MRSLVSQAFRVLFRECVDALMHYENGLASAELNFVCALVALAFG